MLVEGAAADALGLPLADAVLSPLDVPLGLPEMFSWLIVVDPFLQLALKSDAES